MSPIKYSKNFFDWIYKYRGSLLRTAIFTIGHMAIAITCLMLIADVPFFIALTDAIVEPIVNAVWYFVFDRIWVTKVVDNKKANPTQVKKPEYNPVYSSKQLEKAMTAPIVRKS